MGKAKYINQQKKSKLLLVDFNGHHASNIMIIVNEVIKYLHLLCTETINTKYIIMDFFNYTYNILKDTYMLYLDNKNICLLTMLVNYACFLSIMYQNSYINRKETLFKTPKRCNIILAK